MNVFNHPMEVVVDGIHSKAMDGDTSSHGMEATEVLLGMVLPKDMCMDE